MTVTPATGFGGSTSVAAWIGVNTGNEMPAGGVASKLNSRIGSPGGVATGSSFGSVQPLVAAIPDAWTSSFKGVELTLITLTWVTWKMFIVLSPFFGVY